MEKSINKSGIEKIFNKGHCQVLLHIPGTKTMVDGRINIRQHRNDAQGFDKFQIWTKNDFHEHIQARFLQQIHV